MTWCVPRCSLPVDAGEFPRPPSSSAPLPVPVSSSPAVWPASVWTDVCGSGNPGPHTYRWPGLKLRQQQTYALFFIGQRSHVAHR